MAQKESFRESVRVQVSNAPILELKDLSTSDAVRQYQKYVLEQEQPFILCINYINQLVNELKERGIVSSFLEFRARIKSTESALKNDQKKALDDIFGLEFIGATKEELIIIKHELEKLFRTVRQKSVDKDNGYRAIHCSYFMNEELIRQLNRISQQQDGCQYKESYFPLIEVQYKTISVFYEANYGRASHEKYKKAEISHVQELYNKGELLHGEYIPYMWISDPSSSNARELSLEDTIKKMYPSLKLKGKEYDVDSRGE